MFKTKDLTPRYYTNTSRDFQLLGHLLDCAVANVRQGVDGLSKISLDKNIDSNLMSLSQTTLGLALTKNYSSNSLLAVCKSFKHILRLKGSQEAISESIKVLLNSQNIKEEYLIEFSDTSDTSNYNLTIRLPEATQTTELLDELLNYILPAGYTYSIIKSKLETSTYTTEINENSDVNTKNYTSLKLHSYSSGDDFISTYIKCNIPEVGMVTVMSAKDLENNASSTSEVSSSSINNEEEE